jgi:hypothetical protein
VTPRVALPPIIVLWVGVGLASTVLIELARRCDVAHQRSALLALWRRAARGPGGPAPTG